MGVDQIKLKGQHKAEIDQFHELLDDVLEELGDGNKRQDSNDEYWKPSMFERRRDHSVWTFGDNNEDHVEVESTLIRANVRENQNTKRAKITVSGPRSESRAKTIQDKLKEHPTFKKFKPTHSKLI
ncbi:MAG: hypothetical protein GOV15_02740 [Candidatus Diapherotrites archaeon]|nr:hypothetical protein [Candidatus Diapherotrites archaeon]